MRRRRSRLRLVELEVLLIRWRRHGRGRVMSLGRAVRVLPDLRRGSRLPLRRLWVVNRLWLVRHLGRWRMLRRRIAHSLPRLRRMLRRRIAHGLSRLWRGLRWRWIVGSFPRLRLRLRLRRRRIVHSLSRLGRRLRRRRVELRLVRRRRGRWRRILVSLLLWLRSWRALCRAGRRRVIVLAHDF